MDLDTLQMCYILKLLKVRVKLFTQPKNQWHYASTLLSSIQIKNTGSLYLAGGIGFISMASKAGMTFQLKYSMISTKTTITTSNPNTKKTQTENPGFLGLFFGIAI